jgi:RNA polymerase sigma-70 factor (ECF subfamily)
MLWPLLPPAPITRFRRRPEPDGDLTDDALGGRAAGGDVEAFHELVGRHQVAVFNVVLRTMKDPAAAEDVTQDAFLRAWRSLGQFRGGNVRGWLMRIAVNRAYDTLRSQKRRPADSLDALEYEPQARWTAGAATPEHPEGHALRSELSDVLERLLAKLPDDQRTALLLVDLEGFSYDEAAGIMAVAPGTIKSRISRARARLREEMRATTHDSELFDRFLRRDGDVLARDG